MRHLIALIIYLSSSVSFAGVPELLQIEARPTMMQTLEHMPLEFGAEIPLSNEAAINAGVDKRTKIELWTKTLLDYSPRLIATLEKAYPNAIWAFLGRDGAAFSDVFEAFFHSIGESEKRVARFGVSKGSMSTMTIEHIKSALKEQGYDIDRWAELPPILFIDPVSGGNGRQGRRILANIYSYLQEKYGVKPTEVFKRINMVGLVVSTHPGGYNDISQKDDYETRYNSIFPPDRTYTIDEIMNAHQFLSVPQAENYANESGYTHFIGAWHGSYGEWGIVDGLSQAKKGSLFPDGIRTSILWTQQRVWNSVSGPDFLQAVQNEATKLGYEYPISEPSSVSCKALLRGL